MLHAVPDAVQSVSEQLQEIPGAEVPLELLSKAAELGRSASAGTLAELVREALHR